MQDKALIEQLFRSHYRRMYLVALALLHNDEEARDVVSDVFADLLAGTVVVNERRSTESLLLVMTRNRALNILKHRAVEKSFRSKEANSKADSESSSVADDLPLEAIERYIDERLTPQTRTVLRARYEGRKQYDEIARELGISRTAVYKHITQALRKLRQQFNP